MCVLAWPGLYWLSFGLGCSRWGQWCEVMLVDKVREREVAVCVEVQVSEHVLANVQCMAGPRWYMGAGAAWGCPEVAGH